MAVLFTFEVYTPYRLFFSEKVEAVLLTLSDGDAAIYANHSMFTAPVVPCLLKIKDKGGAWKTAFTAEGILEVSEHKTILFSDAAEWPDEIDCERAKVAKEKAEKTLAGETIKFQAVIASTSLRRANMRLKASEEGKSSSSPANG